MAPAPATTSPGPPLESGAAAATEALRHPGQSAQATRGAASRSQALVTTTTIISASDSRTDHSNQRPETATGAKTVFMVMRAWCSSGPMLPCRVAERECAVKRLNDQTTGQPGGRMTRVRRNQAKPAPPRWRVRTTSLQSLT